jgi:hypothetical protein
VAVFEQTISGNMAGGINQQKPEAIPQFANQSSH